MKKGGETAFFTVRSCRATRPNRREPCLTWSSLISLNFWAKWCGRSAWFRWCPFGIW